MTDYGDVKVYTVNGATAGSSSSLPDWLTRKRAVKGKSRKRAVREHVEGTIELMRTVKQAVDPLNIMNPSKVSCPSLQRSRLLTLL